MTSYAVGSLTGIGPSVTISTMANAMVVHEGGIDLEEVVLKVGCQIPVGRHIVVVDKVYTMLFVIDEFFWMHTTVSICLDNSHQCNKG